MSIAESQLDLIARTCEPFSYNRKAQAFEIGARVLQIDDPDLLARPFGTLSSQFYLDWQEARADSAALKQRLDLVQSVPVLVDSFAHAITTPIFNGWPKTAEHLADTQAVIKEVFVATGGMAPPEADDGTGFMSFAATLNSYDHVHLQTFGNCACYGQNPDGDTIRYDDWKDGWVEYAFHNVDASFHVVSLLAGMGHLATLAAQQS